MYPQFFFFYFSFIAHHFPLVAQTEGADGSGVFAPTVTSLEHRAQTRLTVPQQQHVGQVRDVTRRQAQSLDLGELSVHRLGGDESPQRGKRSVDILGTVALPRIGRVALLHHHATAQRARHAAVRLRLLRAAAVAPVRAAAVALAAVLVLIVRQHVYISVVREGVRRHRPQHGESHFWLGCVSFVIRLLQNCMQAE